jgi:ribosome-associated toxin RatA of RatAB toxin-antitoxin module
MKKIIVIILSLCYGLGIQAQSWILKKDKGGIQVYTKSSDDFSMPASKVIAIFRASYDEVVEAVFEVKNYEDYVPDCAKIDILKRTGSDELIYYGLFNAPWPAADRDLVVSIKKVTIANGVRIDMTNKSNYIEVKDNATRIPIYFGTWNITETSAGVKVVLEYQTDPGGSVPDWMVQGAATKTPYNMVENLIEFVN